jgi:hypothetical protein
MSWMLLLWTPKESLGDSAVSNLSLSGKGGKSSYVLVFLHGAIGQFFFNVQCKVH